MNIAIVGIAYNGYEQFIPQWLKAISESKTKPREVVIAITDQYQPDPAHQDIYPHKYAIQSKKPTMGSMRNTAIAETTSEWIMYLSIDDVILPDAIDEFKRLEKNADYICIQWIVRGLGLPDMIKKSPTPHEYYLKKRKGLKGGFIIAQSPFRRTLWQNYPYPNHDYPNAPFLSNCITQGARFVKTDIPCTIYQRRPDSHSKAVLILPEERQRAIREKSKLEYNMKRYFESGV